MRVKTLTMIGATCAVLLASAAVFAQDKPMRVRGTVEQIDGAMMTVKSREGDTLKVKLADEVKVVALVKASLADIKPNSFVGSTAMPQPDGTWKAVEVHIFPEEMRGTGEGDRPYDYKPQSTMTNGTVNSLAKTTMTGTVASEEGTTLTLDYKGGSKKIDVTPQTVIVSYVPGTREELKPGASIYLPAATRQADGTLLTARVNVGRDVAPRQCRTIASVDTRTPRRRMRRAACGDAEISRELRHFAHEADEAIVPAAGNPRLALLFDRTADFIAARQAINVRAVFRQPRQKMRQVLKLIGDDMDDAAFLLHNADNGHITRAEDDRPQAFEHFRPYDHVGDRCFVFDRHEYDAIGRTGSLPACDKPRNARPHA